MYIFKDVEGFEWDEWNRHKSLEKHNVAAEEAEEVFFDENKVIAADAKHSDKEDRFILLGKTKKGRLLYIVFTLRKKRIRIISARSVNKKEVVLYEKAN